MSIRLYAMYIEPPSMPTPSITMDTLLAEEEMNATLQEALTCATCTLHLTKASMHRDLEAGVYDPSRDPPFLHLYARADYIDRSHDQNDDDSDYFDSETGSEIEQQSDSGCYYGEEDEDGEDKGGVREDDGDGEGISPLSKPRPKQIPRYARLITPLQRLSYQSCVSEILSDGQKHKVKTEDVDEDLRFAYYQVDYHIHLHDRARCSMLTLCRDIEDVRQLRGWELEMRQLDEAEAVGDSEPTTAPVAAADELFMVHQTGLWKRRWRLRQRRINEVRRKWAHIMAERKRQREELLLKRQKISRAKVKLYAWKEGDKVLLRELRL